MTLYLVLYFVVGSVHVSHPFVIVFVRHSGLLGEVARNEERAGLVQRRKEQVAKVGKLGPGNNVIKTFYDRNFRIFTPLYPSQVLEPVACTITIVMVLEL
jgi:hypothetical protein